ncbi:MAG: FAD-binding protein [Thermoguttaceae bacterium]
MQYNPDSLQAGEKQMYDVTIIGAGPAGTTLARLLAGKFKVLLIDKVTPKCCGGLLAPNAQKMIAKFGLAVPDSVLIGPQLFSVCVADFDNNLTKHFLRHYINIDRDKFDKWLLSLVPNSVEVRTPARYLSADFDAADNSFTVHFTQDGQKHSEQTRLLVGAEGAFSLVRRQFFPEHPKRKMYTAIQHWFESPEQALSYGAIFDRNVTDFYSWTIPKKETLIVGTAIPFGNDTKKRFALLLDKLRGTTLVKGVKLESPIFRESCQIVRPQSAGAICPVIKFSAAKFCDKLHSSVTFQKHLPLALVGEAAGCISSSSAEGISYALKSAAALADAILESGANFNGFQHQYTKKLASVFRSVFTNNMKSFAMFNPFVRKLIFKSGLVSFDVRE